MSKNHFTTIAMPALNEEGHIRQAILSILPDPAALDYEILVLDGGSQDRTVEVVQDLAAQIPNIRVVENPRRLQASAMNIAARQADPRAQYMVRADCHSSYPPKFVERLVDCLERTQASSVVVPMNTQGTGCLHSAIAATQNSMLGNGGSAHRHVAKSGFVDHGHHAGFLLEDFKKIGGYDESFSHNEDAELDVRLNRIGRGIYLDADLAIDYYPRSTLSSLASQYWKYGSGRARNFIKHGTTPKLRQVAPLLALSGVTVGILAAPFIPAALILPVSYIAACMLSSAFLALRNREPCLTLSGIAAIVMHMSWALGFASTFSSHWTQKAARNIATRAAQ
ncbi:MAG: glycosyltransferase family 2 protein [Alphaproteobacteria bacterium]|nr:glycosyltransferase family 2 protein [Alphaproteobacteria bacterium]